MRALKVLGVLIATLVGLLLVGFGALQTAPVQRLAARAISGPDLRIAGLEGFVPTDLRVATIELRDSEGAWLRVDNASLRWSFASLFGGRVRIERLAAERIAVQRAPVAGKDAPAAGGGSFSLPVGVELESLTVADLVVGPGIAPAESRWRLQGNGLLSADLHEGRLKLDGARTDATTGSLIADLRFDLANRVVDGSLALDEGPGGLLAGFLERPDLERVSVKLVAKGDASAGRGEVEVSAGDAASAKGSVRWQPAGAATAATLQVEAGGTVLARYGGPLTVAGELTLDDAAVVVSSLGLSAAPARLTATGRYDRRADRLALDLDVRSAAPGALARLVPGVVWQDLTLAANLQLEDLAGKPQGAATFKGEAIRLAGAALPPQLPPLGRIGVVGSAALRSDGTLVVPSLDVSSTLANVKVSDGSFMPDTRAAAARVAIDLPSLAPLSGLAERELTGRARVELDMRNDAGGLELGWQGRLEEVGAPGVPPGLIAREITLKGRAALAPDDRWTLSDVQVASEAGTFGVSGRGQGATGRFDLSVDLRELASVRAGLDGTVAARATLELAADGGVAGDLSARGTTQGQPLALAGRFARDAAGGLQVPSLTFHWASAALDVTSLAVLPERTTGQARLTVERLADLGALIGTPLAGSLEAEVSTDPQLADKRLQIKLAGRELASGTLGAASVTLEGVIDDPLGVATADARLVAGGLRGVADLDRVETTVKGDRAGGFDVALKASGKQTAADLAARIELAGEEIRVALARFAGRGQGIPVTLAAPTRIAARGERVEIDPTSLRVGGGRLTVQGVVDPAASDLRLDLSALPLSIVDTFAPGTGLEGTLQAKATVRGALADPRVEATYGATGVRVRRPEAALLPPLSLQGTGGLAGGQASFDARLGAGAATNLALKGKMALAPLAGSATVTGAIDIAPFAPLLGNQVRNVSGTLRSNLTVEIAGGRLGGSGGLDLANAALGLPDAGLRLTGGTGRIALQGETIQVQRIAFQTGGGGTLTANGSLRPVPDQGLAVDLAVDSRRALLVSRPDLAATVSSDLRITGTTSTGIDVRGPITIDRAEINIAAPQTASFPTIDVREVNRPGAAPPAAPAARPTRVTPPPADDSAGTPIRLALTVRAPQAVFVRGRGLDAELGGNLEVAGTPAAPAVTGGLQLRRGTFNLLGRNLVFSRGVVTLDNLERIDPALDFVAGATVNSTAIQVVIKGTSRAPTFTITSTPSLPQDEALALLLFGKPASSLSAFELVQVAQGLAELTGQAGSGAGLLGRLRQGLGLDQLKVGSSGSGPGSVSIEAGRYVAPGVYVGARQGAAGNSSRGVVEIEVLPNTKIEGDIGADSNGRVGVKMEWDY